MNTLNCTETILEDIVSIAVYYAEDCVNGAPPTVPMASWSSFGPTRPPVLSANIAETENNLLMSDLPTLKITNSRTAAGNIYTHDLQIPTVFDRTAAETAVSQMQGRDFHIVYLHTDGSRSISYALPNTATADIDETLSPNRSVGIKLKMQSMSPLINIILT